MSKKIIVTGGTGYIGSHTVIDLMQQNYDVIILDSLARSEAKVIDQIEAIVGKRPRFYQIDLCHLNALLEIFEKEQHIDGMIHFAAYKYVDESVEKPLLYFENNITSLLNVLTCVEKFNVPSFVFSSSCSVYGNIDTLPVKEDTPLNKAESPYARTKQIGEMIIEDFSMANPKINCVSLRYFNPVGAHESGLIGESPSVIPNNLVPRITGTAIGIFDELKIFGTDLPTRDGSCIRDYIHVMDIAEAHTAAFQFVSESKNTIPHEIINLGSGQGVSVKEAVAAFEKVSGLALKVQFAPPRAGDVVAIYSDCSKSKALLQWTAKRDIYDMMRTAWIWEQKRQGK
jgi:UDP-glucose 4-epimerase